ncbi:MAG: DHH family phosphoesterase, partial [Anaerotignum sp.]|nr:DHH family phosphoesterase [Anaerotignum sp.]
MKRWLLKRTKVNTAAMAKELGIRQATAAVLANRGLLSRKEAQDFLYGGEAAFGDPAEMKDLLKGVSLIAQAIQEGKRIAVYGDYDVDGVMSTTILYQTILRCGGKVMFYLPHRQKEGYGLNLKAVEDLSAEGVEVLFTCDNGIAALQEAALAKEKGMTVVLLDHHEPGFTGIGEERRDILPKADAIIDPKQRDCGYPFKHMCAGGLSYKFARLLLQEFCIADEALEKQLVSFAAIATVCDIVDLLGENRAI